MLRQEVLQSMCLINRSADPSVSLGDLRDTATERTYIILLNGVWNPVCDFCKYKTLKFGKEG